MRTSTSAVAVACFVNSIDKPNLSGRFARFAQRDLGFHSAISDSPTSIVRTPLGSTVLTRNALEVHREPISVSNGAFGRDLTNFGMVPFTLRALISRGLLASCAAIVLIVAGQSAAFAADDSSKHFEIKAKPLADALMEFGVQSGLTVAAPTTLTAGKRGTSVRGDLLPTDALGRLLKGSGLTFARAADGTIAIQAMSSSDPVQASVEESRLEKDLTSSEALQEIVVTAERRSSYLEDTPIAVSVFTADNIQVNRIVSLNDIVLRTPGMSYVQVNKQESYISIRGSLVNGTGIGWDDAVTTFVDDVPMTGSVDASLNYFDLKSIEVLRGPQGTLFGRNTTGGAVLINTEAPSFTPESKLEGTYGTYNLTEIHGLFNGPLVDNTLAGKLVIDGVRRDGNIENIVLNQSTNEQKSGSTRSQLLWTPNDQLRVLLGGDYLIDEGAGRLLRLVGNFQPSPQSPYPNLSYDPYRSNEGYTQPSHDEVSGALLRMDWSLPHLTISSITGYRHVNDNSSWDRLGDPGNQIITHEIIKIDQESEEIHIASPSELSDQPFSWLGGIFLLHSHRSQFDSLLRQFNPNVAQFVSGPFGLGGPFENSKSLESQYQNIVLENGAVFAHVDYELINKLRLSLGGRYSYESKSGTSTDLLTSSFVPADPGLIAAYNSIFNPAPAIANYSDVWRSFTPSATLTYQVEPKLLTYFTWAKGYKSGGYDMTAAGPGTPPAVEEAAFAQPFQPEVAYNYEIGEKMTALDGRLRLNTAVFLMNYRNLQTSQLNPATSLYVTSNAGSATARGVEIELLGQVTGWLTVGLNYAYDNAKYTNYVLSNGPGVPPTVNTGHAIPLTPKNSINTSVDSHFRLPTLPGSFNFGGDVTYRSAVAFRDDGIQPEFMKKLSEVRGLLNMHLRWIASDEKLAISLYGKNLTDTYSVVFAGPLTPFYASNSDSANPNNQIWLVPAALPLREYGLTADYRF
jgi:iron complex outermembrane recepter protein